MTEDSFRELFEAHFEDIRRYLYFRLGDQDISTDIAQDTFLKVWEKQMDLKSGKDVRLLYKIAGDLMVSYIRRESRSQRLPQEMDLEFTGSGPEQEIQYRELMSGYRRALMKLPEKQRVVFLMSRMEKRTYREISDRLGISIKAVEKRMGVALNHLRNALDVK